MNQAFIAVYVPSTPMLRVLKKSDGSNVWTSHAETKIKNDIFFTQGKNSTLCIVQNKTYSELDLDSNEISLERELHFNGFLISVTSTCGILGVCSSDAVTIFRMHH
jgi:hypothetical protein